MRLGILGTSRIARIAVIGPAQDSNEVDVVAVASRTAEKAEKYAAEHGIPEAIGAYDELLARPDIDAVYAPLPVTEHFTWTKRALLAGKHVLCEKPFVMSAAEAEELVELASSKGLILAEGIHYVYHPLLGAVLGAIRDGEIGDVQTAVARIGWLAPADWDVYWDAELGGGSTRHDATYSVHLLRNIFGAEPEVASVDAVWRDGVDETIDVTLKFPGGRVARSVTTIAATDGFNSSLEVIGSEGSIIVDNFLAPHVSGKVSNGEELKTISPDEDQAGGGLVTIRTKDGERSTRYGLPSSHTFQLAAFAEAVRSGVPPITGGEDIVRNARVLDEILETARATSR